MNNSIKQHRTIVTLERYNGGFDAMLVARNAPCARLFSVNRLYSRPTTVGHGKNFIFKIPRCLENAILVSFIAS